MDDDQFCGVAGDRLIFGDHDRNGLAVVEDRVGIAVRLCLRIAAAGDDAGIVMDYRDDPCQGRRRGGINAGDATAADRRADDRGICRVFGSAFIGVTRSAGNLGRPLDAGDRLTQQVLARTVERSGAMRPVHGAVGHAGLILARSG